MSYFIFNSNHLMILVFKLSVLSFLKQMYYMNILYRSLLEFSYTFLVLPLSRVIQIFKTNLTILKIWKILLKRQYTNIPTISNMIHSCNIFAT